MDSTANEALRLQPDLPEGHLALGFSYYYGDRDYERALAEFEIAKRDLPNEAQAYMAIGAIQRRQGKWVESTANLEKAAELDPKNSSVLLNLGYNYMATRNFEAADKIFDRGIEAAPESFGSRALKSELAIRWKGDISVAEKELASVPPGVDPQGLVTLGRAGVLTLQRKFKEALQVIQQFRGETLLVGASTDLPESFFRRYTVLCIWMTKSTRTRRSSAHGSSLSDWCAKAPTTLLAMGSLA